MSKKSLIVLLAAAAVLSPVVEVAAGHDLHINGDFRGAPSGEYAVPGWRLTADGGGARILPTRKPGAFMLELRATAERSQSAVSELHAIRGNTLKIDADISGSGQASLRYEAFDAAGTTMVATEARTINLNAYEQELKCCFGLDTTSACFVRIKLTAKKGSVAVFRDVDAEFEYAAAAPAPAVVAAPAPAAVVVAPAPAVVAAPAPTVVAAPAPAVVVPQPSGRGLINDYYYSFRSLAQVNYFQTALPVGSDIEFKLGEDYDRGVYWNVVSYDASICRVKLEHDRDGVFPFRRDKAEFELKAVGRGTTLVELVGGGKKVIIHFSAL